MLTLDKLEKVSQKRKRVGRGGDLGGTSGRGHKGQKARSGGKIKASFEGGQMSLTRRLPRRGFTNRFKKDIKLISLTDLEKHFSVGDEVTKEVLFEKGLLRGKSKFFVKVLANGQLTKGIVVRVDAFSKAAMQAIVDAGGKAELIKES